jgi:O-antigen/teichoic acid export membrane protein
MTAPALRRNVAINALGALVPLAISLVTTPVYIRHIGDARYGVLAIIWALLGYFGFLDLGLSRAAANALARLRDAPQPLRASVLATTMALNLALGLLGSLVLAIFGRFLLEHVLAIPAALKAEIDSAFVWIVALFPLALLSGVGVGALESRERFLLANILQVSGMSLGQIVPVVLAVCVGPSLAIVIPAAVIARALTVCAILAAALRQEGRWTLGSFNPKRARSLIKYGGWVTVSGILSPILTSLDQFVIGSTLGMAAVAHYVAPMNLVTRSQLFAGALARALFPRLSSSPSGEAQRLASDAMVSLAFGYGAICAPAMIVTPVFFHCWVGEAFAQASTPVAEILFFGAWINGVAFVPFGLLQSQGRPDLTGKFHAAEVAPFVFVLWASTAAFGIRGAAGAWSLRCAVDAWLLIYAAQLPRRLAAKALAAPLALMLLASAASALVGPRLWLSFGVAAIFAVGGMALALASSPGLRRAAAPLRGMVGYRPFEPPARIWSGK